MNKCLAGAIPLRGAAAAHSEAPPPISHRCRFFVSVGGWRRRRSSSSLSRRGVLSSPMTLPVINQAITMVIRGRNYLVTCMDVFDGGYGYYFDALFPRSLRI